MEEVLAWLNLRINDFLYLFVYVMFINNLRLIYFIKISIYIYF